MPRGDGTGPMGYGPMTGRAMGYCAGYAHPGYAHPGYGRGMAFRRGWGWRWHRAPAAPVSPAMPYAAVRPEPWTQEQELEALKADADSIRQTLKHIEQRISELSDSQTTAE